MRPAAALPIRARSLPGLAQAILTAAGNDYSVLHSFPAGLKRDWAAVVNGLTLPFSSGVVEGNVNRIEVLKRRMCGRAGFDPAAESR